MTTVVVWKTKQAFQAVSDEAIWVIADSRASAIGGREGVLTDRCAKVFEVLVRVRRDSYSATATIAMAVAGHTLVAHNVIFCLQQALGALVGTRLPTVAEVVEFAAKVLRDLTADVGVLDQSKAFSELIIAGATDSRESVEAWSLRPKFTDAEFVVEATQLDLSHSPYCTGVRSDVEQFERTYTVMLQRSVALGEEQYLVDQLPIMCFDKLFLAGRMSKRTGGEMQIVAAEAQETKRFMPFRYEASQAELSNDPTKQVGDWMGMYRFMFFGSDVFGVKIGGCSIGINPFQLDDIQVVAD